MFAYEFALIMKLLYGTLGGCGIALGASIVKHIKNKPGKLANNEIRTFRELKNLTGDTGLAISKNIRLLEKVDFEGICLVGPTGSYKTSTLFMNNLLENKVRGSFIVTDPKGEIFEKTSSYQKNICKRKVYKIDFINSDYSERYNLLENCKSTEEVLQLASSLLVNGSLSIELMTGKKVGGVEWIQMAEPLFAALLLYAKNLKSPYNTVEFALNLLITLSSKNVEKLIIGSNNFDAITQYNIYKQVGGADRTEGSIKITLSTNTKLFTDKTVNKLNSMTTFDIEKFRKEESILYIIYPERKSSYLAPFIAPLFSQIMDKLIDNYTEKSLPITFLFDEFGNIGMLNNMSVNAATVRSRKISLGICLQSLSQLALVYGEKNAKAILTNLKTKLILPGGSDVETLNYIQNICGSGQVMTRTITTSGDKQSCTITPTKRRVFEDGELRTLGDRTLLVIVNNRMPVLDRIEPYFETNKVKNVSDPVEYYKMKSCNYNLMNEIQRLRASAEREVEAVDERGQEEGKTSKAAAIARRIFAQESQ